MNYDEDFQKITRLKKSFGKSSEIDNHDSILLKGDRTSNFDVEGFEASPLAAEVCVFFFCDFLPSFSAVDTFCSFSFSTFELLAALFLSPLAALSFFLSAAFSSWDTATVCRKP